MARPTAQRAVATPLSVAPTQEQARSARTLHTLAAAQAEVGGSFSRKIFRRPFAMNFIFGVASFWGIPADEEIRRAPLVLSDFYF